MAETLVVGVSSSPTTSGRTDLALRATLEGATLAGASTTCLSLADTSTTDAVAAITSAHGVVFAGPTYRATHNAAMRQLVEAIGRGEDGSSATLQGTAALVLLTGASAHHFLAVRDLSGTLSTFFAAQVLSPGLYLDGSAFEPGGARLTPEALDTAQLHGRALAELATAVAGSHTLSRLRPQV